MVSYQPASHFTQASSQRFFGKTGLGNVGRWWVSWRIVNPAITHAVVIVPRIRTIGRRHHDSEEVDTVVSGDAGSTAVGVGTSAQATGSMPGDVA